MDKKLTSTARSKGAIGPRAVVPRYVAKIADKTDYILDYGAGKNAIHSLELYNKGFSNIYPYDISGINPNIVNKFRHKCFGNIDAYMWDIIFASNVLNVQYKYHHLTTMLGTISTMITEQGKGVFICNYPKSPRKMDHISTEQMQVILGGFFHSVIKTGKSYSPIFICQNNGIIEREI